MKRVLIILFCFLFLCGCARSSGDYERGYADGYDAGYKSAQNTRDLSEYTVEPTPTAKPTSTPRPTASPTATDDFNVYISSSFTMHKKSTCSGMKNYITMPYSVAKDYFTKKCGTCFK